MNQRLPKEARFCVSKISDTFGNPLIHLVSFFAIIIPSLIMENITKKEIKKIIKNIISVSSSSFDDPVKFINQITNGSGNVKK